MDNHKIKKIKFSLITSKLLKQTLNSESIFIFFLENEVKKSTNFTPKIKRSFFFNFQNLNLNKNLIVGGGSLIEKSFYLNKSLKEFLLFIKTQKSCIFFYNSLYFTLNKIIQLNLNKNNMSFLVLLLLQNVQKTFSFFLPLRSLLSNLKLESKK
jgi:hypothetical protein